MIFLCFSVKDRIPLINDFFHFLSNFGLDVWYDRRNIYLGDNRREKNITYGAENPNVNYMVSSGSMISSILSRPTSASHILKGSAFGDGIDCINLKSCSVFATSVL